MTRRGAVLDVFLFLAGVVVVLTVLIGGFALLNDVSKHYGWDGCETVKIGDRTERVCNR